MKNKIILISIIGISLLILFVFVKNEKTSITDNNEQYISIINLIATPENYHQRKVRIKGYVTISFENHNVYLSEIDNKYVITKNSIWLDIELNKELKKYDKKFLIVEGIFDKNHLGHFSLSSGALKNVSFIEE